MALTELVGADEWVPRDTFGARLALVRQRMGWNVKEAAEACGLNDQSWRNWEDGKSPRGYEDVCAKIALRARCDSRWLMAGGPLSRWCSDTPDLTSVNTTVVDPFQLPLAFERPVLASVSS